MRAFGASARLIEVPNRGCGPEDQAVAADAPRLMTLHRKQCRRERLLPSDAKRVMGSPALPRRAGRVGVVRSQDRGDCRQWSDEILQPMVFGDRIGEPLVRLLVE